MLTKAWGILWGIIIACKVLLYFEFFESFIHVYHIFSFYLCPLLTLQSLSRIPNMSPSQLCVSSLVYKITHGMQRVLTYANGCGAIHGPMGNLPGAIPSPSSHQLPVVPQLGVGRTSPSLSVLESVWLDLYRSFEGNHTCWEFMSAIPMPCMKVAFQNFPLYPATTLSCCSLSLGGAVW